MELYLQGILSSINSNKPDIISIPKPNPSLLLLLDKNFLKFKILKIIYNANDIIIKSKSIQGNKSKEIPLKSILSKDNQISCSLYKKEISSYDFFIQYDSNNKKVDTNIIVCNNVKKIAKILFHSINMFLNAPNTIKNMKFFV